MKPIWDTNIPDTITVEHRRRKETRTITNYHYNGSGNRIPVVAWESDSISGVCMIDVWKKWCLTGVDKL